MSECDNDNCGDDYKEVASNLKTTSYTQKEGIIGGHKYAFRVRAKNHIGLSDYSEPLEILAEN